MAPSRRRAGRKAGRHGVAEAAPVAHVSQGYDVRAHMTPRPASRRLGRPVGPPRMRPRRTNPAAARRCHYLLAVPPCLRTRSVKT